jgi:hypothetical protein
MSCAVAEDSTLFAVTAREEVFRESSTIAIDLLPVFVAKVTKQFGRFARDKGRVMVTAGVPADD